MRWGRVPGQSTQTHVVLVLTGPVLGGAERNALELARVLVRDHDHVLSVCALDDGPGRARDVAGELGVVWNTLRLNWSGGRLTRLRSLVRFAFALRALSPDLVIAFTNGPNVLSALTWRVTGARLMVWNQCDVLGTSRFGSETFRRALRRAPAVVTMANHARDWLVADWGVDARRVHVIRSLVELPPEREGRESWRGRLGVEAADIVACMLAHLHAGKDHATLLEAWRIVVTALAAEERRAVLLLAGRDAGGGNAAKALAYDLDLRDHVRFVGDISDVSGFLAAADFAVFSSRSECLGRGATEPMYAGLAVAGTDVPGIREALGPPGAELLAAPGDAEALADAMLRLARDSELRVAIGRANAELIRERQSDERTTRVYAALLGLQTRHGRPESAF